MERGAEGARDLWTGAAVAAAGSVWNGPAARGRAVAAAGEERAPHPAAAVGAEGTAAGGTPAGRRGHRAVPPGAVRPAGAGKMLRLLRTIEIGSRKHLRAW